MRRQTSEVRSETHGAENTGAAKKERVTKNIELRKDEKYYKHSNIRRIEEVGV